MKPILAIQINGRSNKAPHVQEILTKYGCNIRTRVGFHETSDDNCSMDGILILQLFGEEEKIRTMKEELNALDGIKAKEIEF